MRWVVVLFLAGCSVPGKPVLRAMVEDGPVLVVTASRECCWWTPAFRVWAVDCGAPEILLNRDPAIIAYVDDGPLAGPDRMVEHTYWCDFDHDGDVDIADLAVSQEVFYDIGLWNQRVRFVPDRHGQMEPERPELD